MAEVEVFGAYTPDEAGLAQAHRELLGLLKVVRGLERADPTLVQGRRILQKLFYPLMMFSGGCLVS